MLLNWDRRKIAAGLNMLKHNVQMSLFMHIWYMNLLLSHFYKQSSIVKRLKEYLQLVCFENVRVNIRGNKTFLVAYSQFIIEGKIS